MRTNRINNRRGQAMLIAVLSLGGAILGVTTIAGLLTLYQLRATTDAENSAKAIFAADAGVEWSFYTYFHPPQRALPVMANGASLTVTCYNSGGVTSVRCDNPNARTAITKGTSLNTKRAFFVDFTSATTTFP